MLGLGLPQIFLFAFHVGGMGHYPTAMSHCMLVGTYINWYSQAAVHLRTDQTLRYLTLVFQNDMTVRSYRLRYHNLSMQKNKSKKNGKNKRDLILGK